MEIPRQLFCCIATTLSIISLTAGNAAAEPTVEQMQQIMQRSAIPAWQKATVQVRGLRSNPPDSDAAETWKALDSETNVATGKAPLERATTPKDGKDMFILSTWLRWRILSENADPRYSYAYASNLHYMRDGKGDFKREAAVFLFHARVALSIDGARCVDQASPQSIALGFEKQKYIQPLIEQLALMSKNEKAAAMLEAVALEEMRGERPLLGALCTRGARAMQKAIVSSRQIEEVNPSGRRASQSLGKTYSVDVSGIEPEVISEAQWRKRRREIIDSFVRSAVGLL